MLRAVPDSAYCPTVVQRDPPRPRWRDPRAARALHQGGGDDRESDGICGSFLRLDPHHFEQDSADLGEERAHAVAFVPIDELDVRARDAALEAALVGALDVARANRDAPDVRLRAAQDLELAALGRSGDEAAAAVVAA